MNAPSRKFSMTTGQSQLPNCPSCGSNVIYRSRKRGIIDWFLYRVLFREPYRCGECDQRFHRFRFGHHHGKETASLQMSVASLPHATRMYATELLGTKVAPVVRNHLVSDSGKDATKFNLEAAVVEESNRNG
jgi:DNA-directed RNA polymerase subunit RPC12/RpoP